MYRPLPWARQLHLIRCCAAVIVVASLWTAEAFGDEIATTLKISELQGGLPDVLDPHDAFGRSVVSLGDLNGDSWEDLAVGAIHDAGRGQSRGAVWMLLLDADRAVQRAIRIGDGAGGFTGQLDDDDVFGTSLAHIGDLNGDGVVDLAVGAIHDDDGGGQDRGAIWILFLNEDGTVQSHQKISETEGGLTGLEENDLFGSSIAAIGDLDHDGVTELAVGAYLDDDGGTNRGAVWILFLNPQGQVKQHRTISATQGGFAGVLDDSDIFGFSVARLGDLDGDAVVDLAVGAPFDDDGGPNRGAVWILFLNEDGSVKAHVKISAQSTILSDLLMNHDEFGTALDMLDISSQRHSRTLLVGAAFDDDGGLNRGAVWFLTVLPDGQIASPWKVSQMQGGFDGQLDDHDNFGLALGALQSSGAGAAVAVGAPGDDDGGTGTGAVWILQFDAACLADFTGDFEIGFGDLLVLLAEWGRCASDCRADLDDDGAVGFADLLALLAGWGRCAAGNP